MGAAEGLLVAMMAVFLFFLGVSVFAEFLRRHDDIYARLDDIERRLRAAEGGRERAEAAAETEAVTDEPVMAGPEEAAAASEPVADEPSAGEREGGL